MSPCPCSTGTAWGTGWPTASSRSAIRSRTSFPLRIDVKHDPFLDDRLRVANLPEEPQTLTVKNPASGAEKQVKIALFRKAGEVAGARRAVSEIVKWLNYVTDNRVADAGRGPVGIGQSGARQHLGPLRSRDQPAGDAAEGRDPGSGQCLDRHRPGRPERLASTPRSSPACGRSAAPMAPSRR